MRHGIRDIRAERIRRSEIFSVKFLPFEFGKRPALQGFCKLFAGTADRFARHKRLTRTGGISGVRRNPGVAALINDVIRTDACIGNDHLCQNRSKPLSDAAGTGVDMDLGVILDNKFCTAPVRKSYADARVFHCAGQADGGSVFDRFIIVGLDCQKGLHQSCFGTDDLTVRQYTSGTDRVPVTDFPGGNADFVRHHI